MVALSCGFSEAAQRAPCQAQLGDVIFRWPFRDLGDPFVQTARYSQPLAQPLQPPGELGGVTQATSRFLFGTDIRSSLEKAGHRLGPWRPEGAAWTESRGWPGGAAGSPPSPLMGVGDAFPATAHSRPVLISCPPPSQGRVQAPFSFASGSPSKVEPHLSGEYPAGVIWTLASRL